MAAPGRPGRLRGVLVNITIAGLSLGLAYGMAEVLVRVLAPQQLVVKRPDIWQAVDTLGWAHRADVRTTINTGERTVRVFTDRDGFRVGAGGRVEGKKRILLLGDSFMEAFQVEYEQSFAGLLEARLGATLGETVAVRNTGVGGWDPPQYLIQARRQLDREPFDLVLVSVYLGNDVVPRRIDRYPAGPPVEVLDHHLRLPCHLRYAEFVDALLYPVNDFLKAHSQLFTFFKKRMQTLRMRLGLTAEEFPVDLLRSRSGAPDWSVTAELLREIRDLARARRVPALFVLVPAPFQADTAAFYQALRGFRIDTSAVDLDQPNRLLSQAMRAFHLDVLDVLPDFRRAERSGVRLYGTVDPHLSPEGHDVLEREVEPAVAARLSHASGRPPRLAGS